MSNNDTYTCRSIVEFELYVSTAFLYMLRTFYTCSTSQVVLVWTPVCDLVYSTVVGLDCAGMGLFGAIIVLSDWDSCKVSQAPPCPID